MAKYKRSIQPRGFKPEAVSERNISNLQAYSDRIIKALQEEQAAVISNRNRAADAMKQNAQIESQQAATNQKIADQNFETKIKEQSILADQAMRQFDLENKESKAIFGTLAKLSSTAGEKLQEIEISRNKKQNDNDLAEMLTLGVNSPKYKQIEAMLKATNIEEVDNRTKIAQAQERGLPPVEADRLSKNINQLSAGTKAGFLMLLASQYESFLNDKLIGDKTGAARDGKKAGVFAADALNEFMEINRIKGFNPAFLQQVGFLDKVLGVNQRFQNTSIEYEREDYRVEFESDLNASLANAKDDATAKSIVETKWPELVRLNGFGGALDYLQNVSQTSKTDGKPLYPVEGILAAEIGQNGEAFGDRWKDRKEAIQSNLAQSFNTAYTLEQDTKRRQYDQEWSNGVKPALLQKLKESDAKNDLDIIETARKSMFDKNDGYIPKEFEDIARQILAENKAESAEKTAIILEKIRIGRATQGDILSIADPELRASAQEAWIQREKQSKFGEDYEATLQSIKKAAMKFMGESLEGSSSFEADQLNLVMQENFAADYKDGLERFNGDTTRALNYAKDTLREDIKAGKLNTDKNARYHTTKGTNNETIFTNIEALKVKTAAEKDRALQTLIGTIGTIGVSALDSPGLIETELELRKISETNRIGGTLEYTPRIKTAAKILGISELEVINKAIDAHNKVNPLKIIPLTLDPIMQIVNDSRQDIRDLIYNANSVVQIERAAANIEPERLRSPGNMRRAFVNAANSTSLSRYRDQVSSITYDTNQPGIDIFFEDKQFPAVLSGRVKDVGYQGNQQAGYGNFVVVESIDPDTGQPVDVLYSHLESPTVYQPGDVIDAGQIIGTQGGTGSVRSYDGTIASIDFLAPAPAGSTSMVPYSNYDQLRRRLAKQLKN